MIKRAVFLYDYTGIMARPWLDSGYECWCFDGQHPEGLTVDGNHVKIGMWFDAGKTHEHAALIASLVGEASFVFGFPECTDLAVSGAAHFARKREADPHFQEKATKLAQMVETVADALDCPWGVENPVSVLSTTWRKPDHRFDPYQYGGYLPEQDIHPTYPQYIKPRDAYPKKTCIWSGNGFVMPPKMPVSVEAGYSAQHSKLGGKSLKTKNIRSATPRGFAKAVFLANGEPD